jgi:hypothetical protein
MAVQVFVSYARKDETCVKTIVSFLGHQFVVWWDHDLVGGTNFPEDIFKKVDKTQVVIVFWSAHAAVSEWVKNESQAAIERCPTIPILLDDTPLPPHLANLGAIDLRTWNGSTEAGEVRKLAQDITLHLAAARKPSADDVIQSQGAPIASTPRSPTDSLGYGFWTYVLALAICLLWIDWQKPFDNKFSLIVLAVANLPVAILLVSRTLKSDRLTKVPLLYGFRLNKLPLFYGIRWGGFSALIVIVLIGSAQEDWRKAGLFGHTASVQAEIDEFQSPGRLKSVECAMFDRQRRFSRTTSVGAVSDNSENPISQTHKADTLLRNLSDDEELVASGCVEAEWQILTTNPAQTGGIGAPPFKVELPAESEWGRQAEALLLAGKYDEARLLLLKVEGKDAAAQNLLAVLDAFAFGYGAHKDSAFMRFRNAAANGNKVALANLGICYVFGFGVSMDPIYGAELIAQTVHEGMPAAQSLWLLQNGLSLLKITDYAELIKTIRIAAASGSPIATAIEGVLAAQGLSKEPCAPKCSDLVKESAVKLRSMGEPGLAAMVEMNANAKNGKEAVREAAQFLPPQLQKSVSQRYTDGLSAQLEQEMRRINDPVRRAVESARGAR